MSVARLAGLAAIVVFLAVGSVAVAADDEPAKSESFAKVLAQWKAVEKQMDDVAKSFRQASPEDRAALRETFTGLLAKAKAIVPRLRAAALVEYEAKPNADPEVVNVLVGILANDVRADDYPQALALAKTLIDHEVNEDAVWALAGTAAFSLDDFETAEKYYRAAAKKEALDQQSQFYFEKIDDFKAAWQKEQDIRAAEAKADDLPRVKLVTNKGTLVIELFENEAPIAVANFVNLIEKKYYDGLTFHRVISNFMAQGGCPTGDGSGGPGYRIPCECNQKNYRHHFAGTLSMAHAGPNTGGSQFFITFRPTPHLDGKHTAFGRVIEGQDVLAKLERRDPQRGGVEPDKIEKAEVIRKRDHEYAPKTLPDKSR